ncbi:hypothetical protein [Roseovarius sp. MMSF_3281]|uniref:hypothetical protein n=1 Tax=Roseovarius sp. MMSF_3281 TaxID=3046694 RepID=UPI00273D51FD|nr:hypothetical protein [Roseovarius sp. MMSF_3281]
MSFVRPEAMQNLARWREVLIGGAVLALGLWWVLGTGGLLHWIGYAVAAAGLALMVAGFQRARFRGARGGAGVVQVDEGQIAYFGPLTGGAVARSEMTALMLDRSGHPAHWVLRQPGQADLQIPVNAEGAEALFDAFAALPGLRTEYMLSQMSASGDQAVVIWQKRTAMLH